MQATETELASTNGPVARETWLTTCYTHTEKVNLRKIVPQIFKRGLTDIPHSNHTIN